MYLLLEDGAEKFPAQPKREYHLLSFLFFFSAGKWKMRNSVLSIEPEDEFGE